MKKNSLKKFISTFIAIVMIFTLSIPMYGYGNEEDNEIVGITSLVEVDGFVFEITESIDENHQITRTFERNFIPFDNTDDLTEARALLRAFGMSESMVSNLSENMLLYFATTPQIVGSITYMQENELGNTYYVCGIYATQKAESINQTLIEQFEMMHNYGIMPLNERHFGHIRVIHLASFQGINPMGNHEYFFLTAAEWLNMPFFRNFGSIGSAAQNISIGHMYSADIFYTRHLFGPGVNSVTVVRTSASPSLARQDSWDGSGAIFRLPSDVAASPPHNFTTMFHSGFGVSVGHRGSQRINPPDFNSLGTYTHRTINISLNPSLSIGSTGLGFSVGIGFDWRHNNYSAPMLRIQGTNVGVVPGS